MLTADEYRARAIELRAIRDRFNRQRGTARATGDAHSYGMIMGVAGFAADYCDEVARRLDGQPASSALAGHATAWLVDWIDRAEVELAIAHAQGLDAWRRHRRAQGGAT